MKLLLLLLFFLTTLPCHTTRRPAVPPAVRWILKGLMDLFIYAFIRLFRPIYSFIHLFWSIYSFIRLFRPINSFIRLFMPIYSFICLFRPIHSFNRLFIIHSLIHPSIHPSAGLRNSLGLQTGNGGAHPRAGPSLTHLDQKMTSS